MPESVLSRLARSTELSKTESRSAGAARIQSRRTRTSANPTVLETLQTYSACENPVNRNIPQDFQMFSTSEILTLGRRDGRACLRAEARFARSETARPEVAPFPNVRWGGQPERSTTRATVWSSAGLKVANVPESAHGISSTQRRKTRN